MSVQEYKRRLHEVIEETDDEAILRRMLDVTNPVANDRDILDDLSPAQLAGLMEAREQGRQGNYITLDEFKKRMEQKWRDKGLL